MHQQRSRRRPKFNSVEEYLASRDPTKESTLRSVIDLILTQFPELESKISWNVPTIHHVDSRRINLPHLLSRACQGTVEGALFARHEQLVRRSGSYFLQLRRDR